MLAPLRATIDLRLRAAAAIDEVWQGADGLSEAQLAEQLREKLLTAPNFVGAGWYVPPPNGIAVLMGDSDNYERVANLSLRDASRWPRTDVYCSSESIAFIYASPFDATSGIIGDIGATLYCGKDGVLQRHIANCFAVTAEVVRQAEVGMSFAELYRKALDIILKADLDNQIISRSDVTGTNIGHTIPWSYESMTSSELATIRGGEHQQIADMISTKRKFVNSVEEFIIQPNMAFTIEPWLHRATFPSINFHTILLFDNEGKRSTVSGFRTLLQQTTYARFIDPADMNILDTAGATEKPLVWHSQSMGARIDLSDKTHLYERLDANDE